MYIVLENWLCRSCYCIAPLTDSLPHFAEEVEIFLDQTAYSIFENETTVTVTLRLSDVYRQDIAVSLVGGELAGGYSELWLCTYMHRRTVVSLHHWLLAWQSACRPYIHTYTASSLSYLAGIAALFRAQGNLCVFRLASEFSTHSTPSHSSHSWCWFQYYWIPSDSNHPCWADKCPVHSYSDRWAHCGEGWAVPTLLYLFR